MHLIHRWMRVREVIRFCERLFDTWDAQREQELLDLFELPPDRRVKQLSKGMLAKLSLLLALAHDPEVLILDEPTSGLDPLVREEFLDGVLRGICKRERTVLFSSHTLSDVQRMADTVGVIYGGRLIAQGPVDALVAGTKRIRVVLEDGKAPGDPPPGTVWRRHDRREWLLTVQGFSPATLDYLYESHPVQNVEVSDLGLEDIFKDLVKGRRESA
jgi:ABC-2 type transport system ATP-binding protein